MSRVGELEALALDALYARSEGFGLLLYSFSIESYACTYVHVVCVELVYVVRVCMYVCVQEGMHICVIVSVSVFMSMHLFVHLLVHLCTHVRMCVYIYTHLFMYMSVHVHV